MSVTAQSQCYPSPNSTPTLGKNIDPFTIIYYLLSQAVVLGGASANIYAKEMNGNAASQQALNSAAGHLQFTHIPAEQKKYVQVRSGYNEVRKKTVVEEDGGWGCRTTYVWVQTPRYVKKTEVENQGQIQQAMAINQQIAADQNALDDRMSVLQQQAQIQSTNVNDIAQAATQTMDQASTILQIVQGLTFLALLRQQPQY